MATRSSRSLRVDGVFAACANDMHLSSGGRDGGRSEPARATHMNETVPPEAEPGSTAIGTKAGDIAVALRNAAKLGLSLTATWALAIIVRIQLPRHLGPEAFGHFNFAESFAAAFFVFISFGIETYVQKEISVRPQHASDFYGGVVVVRTVVGTILFGVMAVTLLVTDRPSYLQTLVLVCAVTQYLMSLSQFFSAMLRASTNVGVLATVNVASKLLWAVGIAVGIYMGASLIVLAIPALVAELVRAIVLWRNARKVIGIKWRFDVVETKKVMIASLPYFGNAVAITLVNRIDVSMLEFIAPGAEVGWYGAANSFASLAMLLSPLLGWILMPLLARAKRRSTDEFFSVLRRALEGFMVLTIPMTLVITLGAKFWITVAFGEAFAPAALSLQILAPMFVATYACSVLSIGIILIDRPWLVTAVSVAGIVLQPILTLSIVGTMKGLGPGGAGAAAAIGVVGMEVTMMIALLWAMGRVAVDRRNITAVVKSILVALAILPLDHMLRQFGPIRLAIDLFAYAILALLIRVERISDLRKVLAVVRSRGKASESPAT